MKINLKLVAGALTLAIVFVAGMIVGQHDMQAVMAARAGVRQELNPKTALLGQPAVHVFHGYTVTTILSHYDESNDTYEGHVLFRGNAKFNIKGGTIGESVPGFGRRDDFFAVVFQVKGLRPYPSDPEELAERPDYAFYFVRPGEDPEPLREIARRNGQPVAP